MQQIAVVPSSEFLYTYRSIHECFQRKRAHLPIRHSRGGLNSTGLIKKVKDSESHLHFR